MVVALSIKQIRLCVCSPSSSSGFSGGKNGDVECLKRRRRGCFSSKSLWDSFACGWWWWWDCSCCWGGYRSADIISDTRGVVVVVQCAILFDMPYYAAAVVLLQSDCILLRGKKGQKSIFYYYKSSHPKTRQRNSLWASSLDSNQFSPFTISPPPPLPNIPNTQLTAAAKTDTSQLTPTTTTPQETFYCILFPQYILQETSGSVSPTRGCGVAAGGNFVMDQDCPVVVVCVVVGAWIWGWEEG